MTAEQNYRLLQEIEANREFILMAYLLSTPTTTNYVERQMRVTIAQ